MSHRRSTSNNTEGCISTSSDEGMQLPTLSPDQLKAYHEIKQKISELGEEKTITLKFLRETLPPFNEYIKKIEDTKVLEYALVCYKTENNFIFLQNAIKQRDDGKQIFSSAEVMDSDPSFIPPPPPPEKIISAITNQVGQQNSELTP